jgi:hypothetical protein
VSETSLIWIKKRQEKIRKLVIDEMVGWTDEDIIAEMRDIRHLTSLTSIDFDFSA